MTRNAKSRKAYIIEIACFLYDWQKEFTVIFNLWILLITKLLFIRSQPHNHSPGTLLILLTGQGQPNDSKAHNNLCIETLGRKASPKQSTIFLSGLEGCHIRLLHLSANRVWTCSGGLRELQSRSGVERKLLDFRKDRAWDSLKKSKALHLFPHR